MLAYAIDNPAPSTIILISCDRDFAYAVSILRLRRYRVVIISPPSIHSSLKVQASIHVDWTSDVLGLELSSDAWNNSTPESRSIPLSPAKRRISNASTKRIFPPLPSTSQNAQPMQPETAEHVEVDIMTHISEARSRRKSVTVQPPPTMHSKNGTEAENGQVLSLDIIEHTENDRSSSPFEPPSRAESAPAAMELDYGVLSSPSVTVNGIDDSRSPHGIATPPSLPTVSKEPESTLDLSSFQTTQTIAISPNMAPSPVPAPVFSSSPGLGLAPSITNTPAATQLSALPAVPQATSITGFSPSLATAAQDNQATLQKFGPLIESLDAHRRRGSLRPLRSTIAVDIASKDNAVYRRAGVQRFSQYSQLAEKEGVITLGGSQGSAWISLRAAWHGAKLS
jgi:hypothetical protein